MGLIAMACQAAAQSNEPPAELNEIVIKGHYDNAVGTSDAASQGTVTAKLLANRPTLRPAEVLEFVPGVIVTQHSGGGKANQYFLRGFNLDHGTDFATFIDGMPVNMPTHAHGHGYSDLNMLIPELVQRIDYRKGPYAAEDGDFASAGSARIKLLDQLPKGVLSTTLGQNGFARALVANSSGLSTGTLLYALEAQHNDGPWDLAEQLRRFNGVLRYTVGTAANRISVTAMGYEAQWRSTDQVPRRAIDQGLIGRFGNLDPSDGGRTSRYSLSVNAQQANDWGQLRASAFVIRSRLDLFSNFSFLGDAPPDGEPDTATLSSSQFEQAEKRLAMGAHISQHWGTTWAGREVVNSVGLQWRHDRLKPVGLYTAENGARTGTTQESGVKQSGVGLYLDSAIQWLPWLRSVAGLRTDYQTFDVSSTIAANSGRAHAQITSPKLSVVLGPWDKTEYFINLGEGFHSNDARGATARVDALDPSQAVSPVDPLVKARGAEVGLRTDLWPGLQSSLVLWQLKLDSELLFVGDAGTTEANRASRRQGIEWNNHYLINDKLLLDVDLAASKARFVQQAPEGRHIPGAVDHVASMGLTLTDWGPWSAQFQVRHFGPRPLIEDNSVRSKATTLANARVGYRFSPQVKLNVDVFNLFNRQDNDIEYFYESRLPGEANPVADRHIHPVEPRAVRVTLQMAF